MFLRSVESWVFPAETNAINKNQMETIELKMRISIIKNS